MKKKLFSIFALLCMAVTGAWAQTVIGNGWSDDFEGATCKWDLINGSAANKWTLGTATNNGGTQAIYISNDGGTTNTYVSGTGYASTVYAAKLFTFANDEYTFSYDWKANAENNYDYLRVALVPSSVTLTAKATSTDHKSTLPTGWIALDGGSQLKKETDWQNKSVTIDVSAGDYYLVFEWINDESTSDNPPAAIDNVSITPSSASSAPVVTFALAAAANEHGTVTFKVGENAVTSAAEGQTVTVEITPDEGWTVGTVTGEWSAAVAASRGQKRIVAETTDIDMLKDFELTPAGENTWTFTMERANAEISVTYAKIIQNSWIQDIAAVTYTSKALTPTVGVKDGSNVLVEGTDYTVSYSENVNVGTATATVTGTGNYSGMASKTFTINPATLTAATLKKTNLVYDKNGQTAQVATVTAGTLDVPANAYDVSDNTATAVGNYTAKVTGKGNFTGTVEAPFSIVPADAKLFTLTLDPEEFTYNGAEQVPAVTVQDGSAVLVENTDYTLIFTNNVNAGTATVTATGQGNYTGTQTASYKINKAALTVTAEDKSVTFGDEAPAYTVTYDGFVEGEDETVLGGTLAFTSYYRKNACVGEYDITPKGLTSDNYAITFTKGTLTVGKKAMEASFIAAINAQTYTGNALEPTPAITFNGMSLKKDKDFTVDYTNNVNVGTAEVTVTGIGNYEGTLTTSFEITPKILQITWIESIPAVTYTGQALTPAVVVKNGDVALEQDKDYTLDYTNNVNAGTGQAIVTGINNYYFQHSISFTINKAEGAVSYATENVSKQVGDNAFTNELTIVGDGVVSYSSSNTDVATVDSKTGEVTIVGAGEAVITATVKAGKNYEYATPTAQYTVTVAVPTGIGEVESGKLKVEGLFDLNGRRVAQPTKKGVYILNGKKVVMK